MSWPKKKISCSNIWFFFCDLNKNMSWKKNFHSNIWFFFVYFLHCEYHQNLIFFSPFNSVCNKLIMDDSDSVYYSCEDFSDSETISSNDRRKRHYHCQNWRQIKIFNNNEELVEFIGKNWSKWRRTDNEKYL